MGALPLLLPAKVMRPRRRRRMAPLILGAGAFGALASLLAPTPLGAGLLFHFGAALAFYLLYLLATLRASLRPLDEGWLHVRRGAIELGALRLTKKDVARGSVRQRAGVAVVRLVEHRRPSRFIDVEVPTLDDGWRVLEALDAGLGARAVRVAATDVKARWVVLGWVLAAYAAVLVGDVAGHGFGSALTMAITTVFTLALPVVARALRLEVDVGIDGLRYRRGPFGGFVPIHEIHDAYVAAARPSMLRIERDGQPPMALDFASWPLRDDASEEAAIAEETLEEARVWAEASAGAGPMQLLTAPRGEDVSAWVSRLRRSPEEASGYRDARPAIPEVWSAFEDVGNSAVTRAAAAIVLGAVDDTSRRRLRIEAAATADPQLRAVIEQAASDDEGAIAEALAALEPELGARPARSQGQP